MAIRVQILVRGVAQGVGFRPYVFSLARKRALRGHVLNNDLDVLIDVEGEKNAIEQFINEIKTAGNDPARRKFAPVGAISADMAACADCLRELFDPRDRRYRYPFINCGACGPRFTIIEDAPYGHVKTTMRRFAMCGECHDEYENPSDRRFHAELAACRICGPQLYLTDASGRELEIGDDAIVRARELLLKGQILAIKGVGGFHLACDATDAEVVERLRRRKYSQDKPFAMMAASIEAIEEYCSVSTVERDLLLSARRPVALLARKPGSVLSNGTNGVNGTDGSNESKLPDVVALGLNSLGFTLPYAPLDYLLLENLGRPLAMTSGNVSGVPICYEDRDAMDRLGAIADYFLLDDRRIHFRADNSVVCARAGREMILRRSRGYTPRPVKTHFKFAREILACGADLKNAFCLTRDARAFISHHIGDLENQETLRSFKQGIEHFKRLFNLRPEVVAHDLSQEYISTKYALTLDDELIKVGVQHHHAHIASCMADNGIDGQVIGVAMDGLGYGADGRLWGGEFFVADFARAERVAHLEYTPMPGGTKAIREPWRMAAIYLYRALGDEVLNCDLDFVKRVDRQAWTTLRQMTQMGLNCPETSSMERMFDAVASLIGLRDMASYEGQVVTELEALADESQSDSYEFDCFAGIVRPAPVIGAIRADLVHRVPKPVISAKFHNAVARMILGVARRIRADRMLDRVALSGSVFQNRLLLNRTATLLESAGFEVFTHIRVPPNDGGIALGQAAVADALIKANLARRF